MPETQHRNMNEGIRIESNEDIIIRGNTIQSNEERPEQPPERVISAGTWMLAQEVLLKLAVAIIAIGIALQLWAIVTGGPVTMIGLRAIAAAISLGLLSWGLEDPRMNGLPCEKRVASWLDDR